MKSIAKYFATAALAGVCFMAEAQDKPVKSKDRANTETQEFREGIIYRNGQVMQMRNGEMRPIERDVTLSDGSTVTRDGWVTSKSGQRTRLQDGDIVNMQGRVMSGGLAPESTTTLLDGFYKEEGQIYVVENGTVNELDNTRELEAGITVTEAGVVTLPNGQKTVLNEGDYLLMSGEKSTLFDEMKRCNCPKNNNNEINNNRELQNDQSQPDLLPEGTR